ncbi:MAG: hypothetical protein MSG64_06130 [Pyrinomonadaceae bacterium MAG19_C2-C3]|nr:hypothetical protein [Pyrinomonadaceae bacterium MAG19_C2-C3]
MAIVKKRNEQTESRLLLESDEPVELPAAQVDERALVVQFEQHKPFIPELLETLREGTIAELVPVMRDGSTFAIHTQTRTFWIKIWHTSEDMTTIDRVQVISCLPSTRGVRVMVDDMDDDDMFEDDEDADDEAYNEPNDGHESRY